MKIAFVYDAVYPYVKGGAEKRIWELSKRLSEKGHEIHLFGMNWWGGESVIENDGVHLHGVCRAMPFYNECGKRSIKQALWFSAALFPSLLKEDFDVIDCSAFPYFPCFTSRVCSIVKRKPLIVTWHEVWGDYWYEYIGKKGFFGKAIERFCSKLTKHNIAVSERTKQGLVNLGVKSKNITVIPNGIDIRQIGKIKPSADKSDVIFAGRLIREKNVDVLIGAVAKVKEKNPKIKCTIIGDGPEKGKLEKLVNEQGLAGNVKFLGFAEYADTISYMKSSKVFVLPSTREGFGIVVLEANACGLPVIAIKHPMNAAEDLVIDGENGFKVELSDKFIAEKIIQILGDEKLRNGMSNNARESAKKYEWDKIASDVEGNYEGTSNTG